MLRQQLGKGEGGQVSCFCEDECIRAAGQNNCAAETFLIKCEESTDRDGICIGMQDRWLGPGPKLMDGVGLWGLGLVGIV